MEFLNDVFKFVGSEFSSALIRIIVLAVFIANCGMLFTECIKAIFHGVMEKRKTLSNIIVLLLDAFICGLSSFLIIKIFSTPETMLSIKIYNMIIVFIMGFPLSVLFYNFYGKALFEAFNTFVNKVKIFRILSDIELQKISNELLQLKNNNLDIIKTLKLKEIKDEKNNTMDKNTPTS